MNFIDEQKIAAAVESLDLPEDAFEDYVEEFGARQPALLAYIFSENLKAFTQEERTLLLYLMLVIWKSVADNGEVEIPPLSAEKFGEAEDHNWEVMQTTKGNSFREKLDVFFENYPQEDLLAFVEDALTEDEDDPLITREGQEGLFVILKSMIDGLTAVDLIH